jgi:hypothetical protein
MDHPWDCCCAREVPNSITLSMGDVRYKGRVEARVFCPLCGRVSAPGYGRESFTAVGHAKRWWRSGHIQKGE